MMLHTLGQRISRDLGRIIEKGDLNAGDVILFWNGAAAPTDKNLEGSYSATVPLTETIGALIHWVSVRTIERGFTEFQAGDAIITFDAAVDLNRKDLTFQLPDGKTYVQAGVGKKIAEFWDVLVGGQPRTRTLLLRTQ